MSIARYVGNVFVLRSLSYHLKTLNKFKVWNNSGYKERLAGRFGLFCQRGGIKGDFAGGKFEKGNANDENAYRTPMTYPNTRLPLAHTERAAVQRSAKNGKLSIVCTVLHSAAQRCCCCIMCEHPPWQQLFPFVALRHADVMLRDALLHHASCVDGGSVHQG